MTVDELLSLNSDIFINEEDVARFLKWKIPTWATSISGHVLDCKCFCELRFEDLSIQEYHELEDLHDNLRAYYSTIEKETEIRKAALKYDCQ